MNLLALFTCAAFLPMQDAAKSAPPPKAKEDAVYEVYFAPAKYKANETYVAVEQINVPKTVEEAIAQALQVHPDIRLAEAELRVAEAKLAQARLLVTQKVTLDYHRLKEARTALTKAEVTFTKAQEQVKQGVSPAGLVNTASIELTQAKSQVAQQENVWNLVFQNYKGHPLSDKVDSVRWSVMPTEVYQKSSDTLLLVNTIHSAKEASSIMEQLRENLGKKISLEKQSKIDLSQAFARLSKEAGFNLRVRLPVTENKEMYRNITKLELEAAELPLHTWLQLIVDELNNVQSHEASVRNEKLKRYDLYVREYGLLLTSSELAPPDAKTVQDIWKQVRLEKATREQMEKRKGESKSNGPK